MLALLLLPQVVLTFQVEGEGPVRFGHPLPARHVERGLRLEDSPGAELQWRLLQRRPDPQTDLLWVEVGIAGAKGRVRLRAGGDPPVAREQGEVYRYAVRDSEPGDGTRVRYEEWRWRTGEVDWRRRITWLEAGEHRGERFESGEALTEVSEDWHGRWLRPRVRRRDWVAAGVLPPGRGMGRDARERLRRAREAMAELELAGLRGAGDYGRSGGVVTNLEYDTTLGLLRLGLHAGDRETLAAAWRAARQTVDRDRDARSGLPFRHGRGHRQGLPEPGHTWLQGLLLVGAVSADDDLLFAARSLAGALARHPPSGEGPAERARDFGWPLGEMEAWLRFDDDPGVARAADALAASVAARFDKENAVFRFGEGGGLSPLYHERAWLTGGLLLPALRAHLLRRPDRRLQRMVDAAAERLRELVAEGRSGLPVRYRARNGAVFSVFRARETPEVYLLLEGLTPAAQRRLLRRQTVQRALGDAPLPDHPDLATHFSMIARCLWVWR